MKNIIAIYDVECYPNLFTARFKDVDTKKYTEFVIFKDVDSDYFINQINDLLIFITKSVDRLIGYNNKQYDDVLLNFIITDKDRLRTTEPGLICSELKSLSDRCINSQKEDFNEDYYFLKRYKTKKYFKSLDLILLFNKNERISLKQMGINLKWHNIIDLPYPEYKFLTIHEMQQVCLYLENDVEITDLVFNNQKEEIKLRIDMSKEMKLDLVNECRTEIAKKVLMHYISDATKLSEGKLRKLRTNYLNIPLAECVSSKIKLLTFEGKKLLSAINKTVIDPNKKEKAKKKKQFEFIYKSKYLTHTIGLGGIHSNNPPEIMEENDDYIYVDVDASSYYPYLMVNEGFYPAHIGPVFIPIYNNKILIPRIEAKAKKIKITAETLKIVANGTFGLTKAEGFLKDAKVTTSTCLNGELYLVMLMEWIETYTKAVIVYSNTDGLTIRIPRLEYSKVINICSRWEMYTGMSLEFNQYSKIVIMDVNNYLIIPKNGDVKLKGSIFNNKVGITKGYYYPIIGRALYNYYTEGRKVEDTIRQCDDIYDFMASQRSDIDKFDVLFRNSSGTEILQKNNRWIITKENQKQGKIFTRSKEDQSLTELQQGHFVTILNKVDEIPIADYHIDYNFYINEAMSTIRLIKTRNVESHMINHVEQLNLFQ